MSTNEENDEAALLRAMPQPLSLQPGSHAFSGPSREALLSDLKFEDIHCGEYHSLAVTRDSLVYTWGSNIFGELTQGSKGSLRKVACYTEPQYRGKNLQDGSSGHDRMPPNHQKPTVPAHGWWQ